MEIDRSRIYGIVIRNAFLHDGRADMKAVMNKVMGEFPEARKNSKIAVPLIKGVIDEVNSLSQDAVMAIVERDYPELLVKEKKVQEHRLPDLRDVDGSVVMRLAPSPSGPLHIGHSRMAILNDEYVRRYGGDLVLRIEDTNPKNIDPVAYTQIPLDLEWLGVNVTSIVIQSDRMGIYYEQASELLKKGHMYVCSCSPEEFRELRATSAACPHRNIPAEENIETFNRMLGDREFCKGKSVVVKTDLNHPNPSVRDWIAFRFVDGVHPRQGTKYWLYPLMNFSVAVDDHLLGLTHIMRGKDHINNTEKQKYIFDYNSWEKPVYYHFGLVNIPDTILHASEMKAGIKDGTFSGWDDVRLGTLVALKKRGYLPETIRRYWIESGMREIDAEFSWDIFNSINRELVDKRASRLFFVPDPVIVEITFPAKTSASVPYHPGDPDTSYRNYEFDVKSSFYIPGEDFSSISDGEEFRLKDLCNLKKCGDLAEYAGNDHTRRGMRILQWAPAGSGDYEVEMPDGIVITGKLEPLGKTYDGVSQLERFGYVRVYGGSSRGYFLHK